MRTWPALILTFPTESSLHDTATLQDLVSAELDGMKVVAIAEQPDARWQVVFGDDIRRAAAVRALAAVLGTSGLAVAAVDVPDENWARRSQAALVAVRVGGIVVAPPWDPQAAAETEGTTTIVIEPAMGFGSGHHATTRLCLAALQRLDLRGRCVVDIGTGSGVLALAAARLGAATVLAIDVDADALDNARLNATLNGCPPALEFREMDFRQEAPPSADVVMANLTGGMLAGSVAAMVRTVAQGGALILSGITVEERPHVLAAFQDDCTIDWTAEEDGWVAALLRRRP